MEETENIPNTTNYFLEQQYPSNRLEITVRSFIVVSVGLSLIFTVAGLIINFSFKNKIEYKAEYGNNCSIGSICTITIEIDQNMKYPIALLYELQGFYQNHILSMRSRSDKQLLGAYVRFDEMERCKPFRSENDDPSPNKWILPCGLQPLTFFNDTFEVKEFGQLDVSYPEIGIAPHDLNMLYVTGNKWLENMRMIIGEQLSYRFADWMDTAAFSTFRRIFGVKSRSGILPKQNLTITYQNNYNASAFGGKKFIILTEKKNEILEVSEIGVVYISLAIFMIILAFIAAVIKRYQNPI